MAHVKTAISIDELILKEAEKTAKCNERKALSPSGERKMVISQ